MLLVFSFKEYMSEWLAIKREHASLSCHLPIILNECLNGHAQIAVRRVESMFAYLRKQSAKISVQLVSPLKKIFILYAVVAHRHVCLVCVLFNPAITKSSWATEGAAERRSHEWRNSNIQPSSFNRPVLSLNKHIIMIFTKMSEYILLSNLKK